MGSIFHRHRPRETTICLRRLNTACFVPNRIIRTQRSQGLIHLSDAESYGKVTFYLRIPSISELGLSLRKEKKEATVQHILKTAEHIFAKRGLISPSIREIAEAAGMSKQALMHHFPSKEMLWSGVIEQIYINSEKLFSLLFTVLNNPEDEVGMTQLLDALEQPPIQNMSRFLLRAYIDEHEAQALEDRSLIVLSQEHLRELTLNFEIENSPKLYVRFTNLNLLLLSTIAVSITKNTDLLPSQDHRYWRRQQIVDVINLYKELFTSK